MKAKTASNAILYGEAGQDLVEMVALSDSGDNTKFNSAAARWSDASGKTPDVKPNGLATGGVVSIADSGSNDVVDITALTCYLAGVETEVSASTDESITRGDSSYLLLTLAASGYTSCVAGDIGKTVTGGVTGDTGELIAYNNTTREWLIDPTEEADTFDDDDEALTIVADGTGAGDLSAVGAEATHKICSIQVTSAGAISVVEGDEGTSFTTTRGVPGGAPYVLATSIEIAQVRYTSTTSAAVDADEIKQVVNTHCERYDYPNWDVKYSRVTDGVAGYAGVTFLSALPDIHTGDIPKAVYAEYYTPSLAEVELSSDFVPPENSYSVNSEQVYGATVGTESSSLGAGSFKSRLSNGVNDTILLMKDDIRWFVFYPDRLVTTKYISCQGKVGVKRGFPAGNSMTADVTIAASEVGDDQYS